jgi:TRAP-type C4-dicarboxylate transport system substrate-binding protein
MVFMSKKKLAGLTAAQRKVLEDNGGEAASRAFGRVNDGVDAQQRQAVIDKGQTVVHLTPAQEQAWRKRLGGVADEWVKRTPNGAKILSTYRELVSQVKLGS